MPVKIESYTARFCACAEKPMQHMNAMAKARVNVSLKLQLNGIEKGYDLRKIRVMSIDDF
jgi:hypothetical protein